MWWNNNDLFSGNDWLWDDFCDERLMWEGDNNLLDIDLYIWEVWEKVESVITKTEEIDKSKWFKKILIELNWEEVEIEYKIDTSELLDFNASVKKSKEFWSRLVNEEEFQAICNSIWNEEFTQVFPWVLYSDKSNTIGAFWKMVYFWVNWYGFWENMKVKIFSKLDMRVHDSEIWKQYGACHILIKK